MSLPITLAVARRVLTQLRRDPRTIAMMLVVPCLLLTLMWWMFDGSDVIFDRFGPPMLAMFPFIVMFLVTSVTTLRERSSGTLERLLSMPLHKLDLLLGYALAFGAVALVQATVAVGLSVGLLDMHVEGSVWVLTSVAVLDAVLGTVLGLFVSAFAETEFQAVQFMPALVLPQVLLCGLFAGKVAKGLGLPRLTGYLLIGVVVGPYALGFIPGAGVKGLEVVKGLAVSLIALVAGTELQLGLIRRVGAKVAALCVGVCGVTFLVGFGALFALKPFLPFLASMTVPQALAVSALVSTVVVSFSPTVTIAIVQETSARGTFTEFLMALVIIGDLYVMVAFAIAAGVTKASFGAGFNFQALVGEVGWELFGSVGLGALLAVAMLVYMRRVNRELPLFLVGLCFAAAEGGTRLHLSPLLVALSAGALIANLDERQSQRIHHAIQQAGLPVFALFFAAAGAGLKLDTLVGPAALLLVLVRAVAIHQACRRFAPAEDPRLRRFLWMGLISQAGVTFGLAALVSRTFPDFGPQVEVLIVAMITAHELIGPVLTRRSLEQVGETRGDERPHTA